MSLYQTLSDIIFILDESGSMDPNKKEIIDSINSFIDEQKIINKNSLFSLITFNSIPTVIFDNVPLSNINHITLDQYNPNNMTALNDAIGNAILLNKNKKNIIFVILTDGEENCSKFFSTKKIKSLILDMESNNNWKFIYLGANQDSFNVGSNIGISQCFNYEANAEGINSIKTTLSSCITKLRSCTLSQNS